ncbi:MAG: Maf family protein [Candidatus Kariarchaeaceae archaeon]
MHNYISMIRQLCLASQSASRKELLNQANVNFVIRIADIDETLNDETPRDYVSRLAQSKAKEVIRINETSDFISDILVAADSIAVVDGTIIGKPKTKAEAVNIIKTLSGRTHDFLTGMYSVNLDSNQYISSIVKTEVTIADLTDSEINFYVDKIQPYSWAGAYSVRKSSYFIKKINGSISNLQGLPMHTLNFLQVFQNRL